MTPRPGFAIGVDLGTSNTVAVMRWPDGRTRPLLFDGAPLLPSGVYLDEYGRFHTGRDATRLAQVDPARFEPNPKRRVDEPRVLLGDRDVATVDLLAAVLVAVGRAAVEAAGFLPPAVLTYPAAWGAHRRDVLVAAAGRAGWPPPLLVPEPVAAARYFADVLRRPVPVGAALAVFDFGGGTVDVAVVRNEGDRFSVLGSGGVADLGGLDLDAALVNHLGTTLGPARPDLWRTLTDPRTPAQRRDRRLLWEDVRAAKEMLSRTAAAPVAVHGLDNAVHLTRDELEHVAAPLLHRAVQEAGAVIARCGLRPDALAGLFLVGGSSRVPLVARMLHAGLGIAPTVLEQPELPVAEGALAELPRDQTDTAGVPVSGIPASPGPPAPPVPPQWTPPAPARPSPPARRPWRAILVAGIAAVLVLAVGAAALFWWLRREDTVEFTALSSTKVTVPFGADSIGGASSATLGDRAYIAWFHDRAMDVAAIDLGAEKKLWQVRMPAGSDRWRGVLAGPGAVLVLADDSSDAKARPMYALDPATGKVRWQLDLYGDDQAVPLDGALVIQSDKDDALRAYDWRTGARKWELPNRTNASGARVKARTLPVTSEGDYGAPATFRGEPARPSGDDPRLVQVDTEDTLRVVDAGKGTTRERKEVASVYDPVYAHAGKLYVVARATGYQLREYDLAKLGEPRVVYTQTDTARQPVGAPQRCGADRICLLERASSDDKTTEVVAVDVKDRKVAWRRPAPLTERLVAVGAAVLATSADGEPASALYGPDGKQVLSADDRKTAGVRLNGTSLLLFSTTPSTYLSTAAVTGVTASGQRRPLGSLERVHTASCSWNTTHLTCAAEKEFRVWRFAN